MKEFRSMEKLTYKILLVVSFFLFSVILSSSVLAQEEGVDGTCQGLYGGVWSECVYNESIKGATPDLDIRRTQFDLVGTSATEFPMFLIFGNNMDTTQGCAIKNLMADDENLENYVDPSVIAAAESLSEEECAPYAVNPLAVAAGLEEPTKLTGRFAGSLAGIGINGATMLYSEPMPISLAFYAKSVASKIPFVKNTAFAQGINTEKFIGFSLVLNLWELTRNIAFGLVAIIMVIIGIMIMMRKQIDPRTAVTVQNALPRVIISLVLITFSYALGALAVALILPLTSVALEPIRMAIRDLAAEGPAMSFLMMGSNIVQTFGPLGFLTMSLNVLMMFSLFLMFLFLLLKLLVAYIKILVLVVASPLTFAWGAIPGNENSINNWFKSLAAAVLTVPAITFGLSAGMYFWWTSQMDAARGEFAPGSANVFFAWLSPISWLMNMLVPLIVIVVFYQTSKFPKKIEEALIETKKKK